jgi:hypothetical protein
MKKIRSPSFGEDTLDDTWDVAKREPLQIKCSGSK